MSAHVCVFIVSVTGLQIFPWHLPVTACRWFPSLPAPRVGFTTEAPELSLSVCAGGGPAAKSGAPNVETGAAGPVKWMPSLRDGSLQGPGAMVSPGALAHPLVPQGRVAGAGKYRAVNPW